MKMSSFTRRPDHLHSPNTRKCLVLGNSAVFFFSIIILDISTLQEFPGKIILESWFFLVTITNFPLYIYINIYIYISLKKRKIKGHRLGSLKR